MNDWHCGDSYNLFVGFVGCASSIFIERFSEKLIEKIFESDTIKGSRPLTCNVSIYRLRSPAKVAELAVPHIVSKSPMCPSQFAKQTYFMPVGLIDVDS